MISAITNVVLGACLLVVAVVVGGTTEGCQSGGRAERQQVKPPQEQQGRIRLVDGATINPEYGSHFNVCVIRDTETGLEFLAIEGYGVQPLRKSESEDASQ